MGEAEQIDRVVKSLETVPEKSLLIIELANKIPIHNGQMDAEYLSGIQPEVNLATAEAKMYGAYTISAVSALREMAAVGEEEDV